MTLSSLVRRWGRAISILLATVLAASGIVALTAVSATASPLAYSTITVFGPDESPVEYATVLLRADNHDDVTLTTDSAGVAVPDASVIDSGIFWTVYITPPTTALLAQYWDGEAAESTSNVYFDSEGGTLAVTLEAAPDAVVSGKVAASTAPTVGLADVQIGFEPAAGGQGQYTSTDANGEYSVAMPPGTYTSSYALYSTSNSFPYGFSESGVGETDITGDVDRGTTEIVPKGLVTGSVERLVDGALQPVDGQGVVLYTADGNPTTGYVNAFSADGSYRFTAPPGSYKVGFGEFTSNFSLVQAYDKVGTIDAGSLVTVSANAPTTGIDAVYDYVAPEPEPEPAVGVPTITGSAAIGSTLTAHTGTWDPAYVDFAYQWLRAGSEITGANASTYLVTDDDFGSTISVRVTGGYASTSDSATSAATAAVVDPDPASVTVTVENIAGYPASGAWVSVVGVGSGTSAALRFSGETGSDGVFAATGLVAGDYSVEAGLTASTVTFARTVSVSSGVHLDLVATVRETVMPPSGTTLTPSRSAEGQVPSVFVGQELTFVTTARASATTADYTVTFAKGGAAVTGTLSESPAGTYTATIPPLTTFGSAVVTATFGYATGAPATVMFDIYIDPSGTVVDQYGTPVDGATVTLARSDTEDGPYTVVPDGSALLSPANRTNPDTTGADGRFGWDVVVGWYTVTATKSGVSFTSEALPVPPEQLGVLLTLTFPGLASPLASSAPTVTGVPAVGNVLSVASGTWTPVANEPSAIVQSGVQWTRDGVAIAGATGETYTVVAADAGRAIAATVTAGRSGFQSWTLTTATVVAAAATNDVAGSDTRVLAATGADITATTGAAVLLMLLGTVAVLLRRRRPALNEKTPAE